MRTGPVIVAPAPMKTRSPRTGAPRAACGAPMVTPCAMVQSAPSVAFGLIQIRRNGR
jgi:hypothetical protein